MIQMTYLIVDFSRETSCVCTLHASCINSHESRWAQCNYAVARNWREANVRIWSDKSAACTKSVTCIVTSTRVTCNKRVVKVSITLGERSLCTESRSVRMLTRSTGKSREFSLKRDESGNESLFKKKKPIHLTASHWIYITLQIARFSTSGKLRSRSHSFTLTSINVFRHIEKNSGGLFR